MGDQVASGKLSPWLRSRRVEAVRPFLKGKVLDVGCGAGYLAQFLLPENYIGIDVDEEVLKKARQDYPLARFQKERPNDELFDTIVLLAVIEHIKDPAAFLKDLTAVLKPEGKVLVTTPHPSMKQLYRWGAKISLFSKDALDEHEEFFDHSKVEDIFSRAGLETVYFRRFLLGANQLFVAGRKPE